MRILTAVALAVITSLCYGCDPEHRKYCEWFLMPDLARKDDPRITPGNIPVCARNLVVNKEDCRLQAEMDFAKSAWNRKFRYSKMRTEGIKIPQKVVAIEYCE